MTRSEARKNIIKTNKLRRRIKKLGDRLWREPISGKGFDLYQRRLKEAVKELKDGDVEHREALKTMLCR